MKKFVCLLPLVFIQFFYHAAATTYVGLGLDVPFLTTTVHWDDSSWGKIDKTDHSGGHGFGFNSQFRYINENTKFGAILDTDLNYADFQGITGFDSQFLLGLGKVLGTPSERVMLSALIGMSSDFLSQKTSSTKDNYTFVNFLIGLDGFFAKELNEKLSFYLQTQLLVGAGAAVDNGSGYVNGYYISGWVSGDSEIFYLIPKAGLLFKL